MPDFKSFDEEKYYVVKAMRKYGGNFVTKLADAIVAADNNNTLTIKSAFESIWTSYKTTGFLIKKKDEDEDRKEASI